MQRNIVLLLILLIHGISIKAQISKDTLWMEGNTIVNRKYNISKNAAVNMMRDYPDAQQEMRNAVNLRVVGKIFEVPGSAMLGFPLGQLIAGGEPNLTMAAIGAGLTLLSIPFAILYKKHARAAIKIYNSKITASSGGGKYGTVY